MNTPRIIVITGATGGLGVAIAAAFRATGDTVAGLAREGADFSADLTDPAAARGAVAQIVEMHGGIDVLVHAMGAFAAGQSVDTWSRMLSLNLMSAVHVLDAVVPVMNRAGHGRIVAVGSRAAVQPSPGLAAYAASKAALNTYIQTLAVDLKDTGITANVVLPGVIRTPANLSWGTPEQVASWTDPASIAGLIHWLASDAAADVSGALVPVYGRS